MTLPIRGKPTAKILVVCEPPSEDTWASGAPIDDLELQVFGSAALDAGLNGSDFAFTCVAPPVALLDEGSDSRTGKHLKLYEEAFDAHMLRFPNLQGVVCLGKWGIRQVARRATAITKVRGQLREYEHSPVPVFHMQSPGNILRVPDHQPTFLTDMQLLKAVHDRNWTMEASYEDAEYEWLDDLEKVLALADAGRIRGASLDTETTGLRWYRSGVVPLTAQISWQAGHAIVFPLHQEYGQVTTRKFRQLKAQARRLITHEGIKWTGHNTKYDNHILRQAGIAPVNWYHDTQLLAFFADENMRNKGLDDCVRRWVPDMAGYADKFNAETDKSRMIEVPHDKMLRYGGGDADASFRLARILSPIVKAHEDQWNCYRRVQWPAQQNFANYVEPNGIHIDLEQFGSFGEELQADVEETEARLLEEVPAAVRRKHAEKGLRFSRPDFVRDIFFSPEGFNLTPQVFTKGTMKLPPDQQVASTSVKDHLPFFAENEFVADYIELSKSRHMLSSFVGHAETPERDATGFYQYFTNGRIYPSFILHRTVTGRTASSDPNAQNLPKRSRLASIFRQAFVAPPGYVLMESDLSQAELRIAATMAHEPTMIQIYREGGDIHRATAAVSMGISTDAFANLPRQEQKDARQGAKAVNFGFLYGMGGKKFRRYAKTEYNVDFTEEESYRLRETFFETYPGLVEWHETMREAVRINGYVQALHGAVRHLPGINSTEEGIQREAERQAINSPVQRFASDLGLIAFNRICRDIPSPANDDYRAIIPIAFIHDALVFYVREELQEEAAQWVKFYMETPPLRQWFQLQMPLPIVADVSVGPNLGQMTELENVQPVAPSWFDEARDFEAAA